MGAHACLSERSGSPSPRPLWKRPPTLLQGRSSAPACGCRARICTAGQGWCPRLGGSRQPVPRLGKVLVTQTVSGNTTQPQGFKVPSEFIAVGLWAGQTPTQPVLGSSPAFGAQGAPITPWRLGSLGSSRPSFPFRPFLVPSAPQLFLSVPRTLRKVVWCFWAGPNALADPEPGRSGREPGRGQRQRCFGPHASIRQPLSTVGAGERDARMSPCICRVWGGGAA